MGSNRKLLFGVLLVVGAVVFWGLYSVINNARVAMTPTPVPAVKAGSPPPSKGLIAKATRNIPQGSIVTKDMYEMVPLLGGAPTAGFVTDPDKQALGYITSVAIPKGAQIRPDDDFIGHISETGIAAALRPGTRAIVVPFANKPTLHDLVHIGNFIDVNAAFDGQEARTIVEGVRVLAVDVFASDFPVVNAAMRGPYKAEAKGSTAPVPVPGEPGATPTPTAAPAQAPARPEPAVTLEVTPAQANTILLAQASGAVMDFVVLPAGPDGNVEPIPVDGGSLGGTPGTGTASVRTVSVTKSQIAPYAESRKNAKPAAASVKTVSTGGGGSRGGGFDRQPLPLPVPQPTFPTTVTTPGSGNSTPFVPPSAPQTYDIPIYADGKTVRVETVRRPQE